jgi:hypothetical protein
MVADDVVGAAAAVIRDATAIAVGGVAAAAGLDDAMVMEAQSLMCSLAVTGR